MEEWIRSQCALMLVATACDLRAGWNAQAMLSGEEG